jgi:hypothetical protein
MALNESSSFTPRSYYLRRKSHRYPTDTKLTEPRTDLDDVKRIKLRFLDRPALANTVVINECGAVSGTRVASETEVLEENLLKVEHCPPQIPHDVTWDRMWGKWQPHCFNHGMASRYIEWAIPSSTFSGYM